MEIVKDIAAVIGCLLSIVSLITLFTKTGRDFVLKLFKKHTKELVETNKQQSESIAQIQASLDTLLIKIGDLEQVSKQQLRDTIKNIYYKYRKEKKIPLYERKTADYAYDLYAKVYNGNSYASLLYNEICKWEIDDSHPQDFDDEGM